MVSWSDIWHSFPGSMASRHNEPPSITSTPSPSSPPSTSSSTQAQAQSSPSQTSSSIVTPTFAKNPPHKATRSHTSTLNGFCGAVAGIASGVVTCPLDVIKTRLQNQRAYLINNPAVPFSSITGQNSRQNVHYRGMIGTARVIFREEGVRGFYRGLGPLVFGYLPTWAVYMGVYDASRDYYSTKTDTKWLSRVGASITAGACSTLATNPIWVIKTRLMSQSVYRNGHSQTLGYTSAWDAACKMYRTEGFRAFYSGLVPALFGLSHVAIQFPLYEYFKLRFTGLEMGENPPEGDGNHYSGIMAATFLSKICATSATYPHEVLRTRLQNQRRIPKSPASSSPLSPLTSHVPGNAVLTYSGVVRTIKMMLQEEGWRSFYAGMGTNMFRAVPAAMTTMLTFEFVKATLQRV